MSALPTPAAPAPSWADGPWPNRYAALGEPFCVELAAAPFPEARWAAVSPGAAADLGWPADWWRDPRALPAFTGQAPLAGMRPVATVYSGHQFGVWAGQLGDGRALLVGEAASPGAPDGPRELQLKGAGRTPYSRGADGRAVLRSSIREFLCSEAMHGLGIPTTRALCLAVSDLPVRREALESAAIVTRTAPSFVRFGHFEHFAFSAPDPQALRRLADHVIATQLPHCADAPRPYAALLQEVVQRTARLVAQWQAVGFCHGVMNTDNMSILGLTIDYGPFGFLDAYDPGHICNHSDDRGRYAYGNQPQIAWWNLHVLGAAMSTLIGEADEVKAALETFQGEFARAMGAAWQAKFGLRELGDEAGEVIDGVFKLLAAGRVDYSIFFRRLADFSTAPQAGNAAVRDLFLDREAFDAWAVRYAALLRAQGSEDGARSLEMKQANPRYVLRNHLAETAIRSAREGDFSEIERLLRLLERPYDEHPGFEAYAGFPPDWAQSLEVSCSS
jgi:uncharacterized protein YdiU (UPF0061 family)